MIIFFAMREGSHVGKKTSCDAPRPLRATLAAAARRTLHDDVLFIVSIVLGNIHIPWN